MKAVMVHSLSYKIKKRGTLAWTFNATPKVSLIGSHQ
jgi:hypothetical protein